MTAEANHCPICGEPTNDNDLCDDCEDKEWHLTHDEANEDIKDGTTIL